MEPPAVAAPEKRKERGGRRRRTGGRKRSDGGEVRIFPPLLTTLNCNGRPIFHLKKESTDGRLVIYMSPNARKEIVRVVGNDGRLTMQLLVANEDGDPDEESDDDVSEECGSGGDGTDGGAYCSRR
ncbi:hypothetical protein Dimus_036616 [Dionaea muscipula]